MKKGIELAANEINASGGINGSKLVPVIEDNQSKGDTGLNVMQKLATENKLPVVLTSATSVTLASLPVAEKNEVLMLNGGAGAPTLQGASKWLYSNIPLISDEAQALLTFAYQERSLKRLAFYGINDDSGKLTEKFVVPLWQKLGGTVVADEIINYGTLDHSSQIAKLKQAKPDVVFIVLYGQEQVTFVKQTREQGLDAQILGLTAFKQPDMLKLAGKSAEGSIFTQYRYSLECTEDPCKTMVADWRKTYKEDPPHPFAVTYYDLTYVVRDLIKYTQTKGWPYDGAHLRQALQEIRTFPGASGTTTFRDDGSAQKPLELWTVKNGEFVLFKVVGAVPIWEASLTVDG